MVKPKINIFKAGNKTSQVIASFSGQEQQAEEIQPEQFEEVLNNADVPVVHLLISKLHDSPWQPTNRYRPEDIDSLEKSVRSVGQITDPILVRPHPTKPGEHEILGGHKRKEVAKRLEYVSIEAKIFNVDDDVAFEIFAANNLQRTQLTELQETDIILNFLKMRLGREIPEITSLIQKVAAEAQKGITNSAVRDEDRTALLSSFSAITTMSLETFRVHRLRWLNMPEEILTAVRQGRIGDTHAKTIAKLDDPDLRDQLLKEAIAEGLSSRAIAERVEQLKGEDEPKELTFPNRLSNVVGRVKKTRAWEDPKKQKKLNTLLRQLEELLGEE